MGKRNETKVVPNSKVSLIHGFSDLFGEKDSRSGIEDGSTLLISGPPGSGKTTFALAMVRALMAEAKDSTKQQKVIAYYISSEVSEKRLKLNYRSFGWFFEKNALAENIESQGTKLFRFRIDDEKPDDTNFYAITPTPEVDRPVPSPEELINRIFNQIAHTLYPSEGPAEGARIYVIVDSITALLKGCANSGDERRQTHEIMHRLRDRFSPSSHPDAKTNQLALTILLAEQEHRVGERGTAGEPATPTTPSVEDYLADIVFRLFVRPLPLGRRARVLEVVKSQGVNMILGEHSWQIITEDNYKLLLRDPGMRSSIKCASVMSIAPKDARKITAKNPEVSNDVAIWGGIIIFPRPQLQRGSSDKNKRNAGIKGKNLESGITGFKDDELDIRPGTTTLIAGPVGSGKTSLCRQFLTAGQKEKFVNGGTTRKGKQEPNPVLVSFDVFPPGYRQESSIDILDFTQSKFDLNVLVAHIFWIFADKSNAPTRLAFDGLSEWITMFDEPEAARMLEALMVTVKQCGSPPAVFMTYALGIDEDPLGPQALGMNAENILVVRQIPINDQLRRILYVLKSKRNQAELEVARELIPCKEQRGMELKVEVATDTLDFYTGLLGRTGSLKPAKVLLLLFAENQWEEELNAELYQKLVQQHKGRLDITHSKFSRSEIGSTLDSVANDRSPGESASLKLESVDEWWLAIGKKETGNFLHDVKNIWNILAGEHRTVNWSDYWSFEVEKATIKTIPSSSPLTKKDISGEETSIYAVPGYMDFGMFCVNRALWLKGLKTLQPEKAAKIDNNLRDQWTQLLADVPRLWVRETKVKNTDWFDVDPEATEPTILDYALRMTNQNESILQRNPVFTFDIATRETCVCAFLEFAWTFGAREALFGQSEGADAQNEMDCAFKALTFLQFMLIEGLMPQHKVTQSETDSRQNETLFSRHFYSTLHRVPRKQKMATDGGQESPWIALPFMPTGLGHQNTAIKNALDDIKTRLSFWRDRVSTIGGNDKDLKRLNACLNEKISENEIDKRLDNAVRCYQKCRDILLTHAKVGDVRDGHPTRAVDLDDLIELAMWAAFRLELLHGNLSGRFCSPTQTEPMDSVTAAMSSLRMLHQNLPELAHLRVKKRGTPLFTGYGCTGSWMYGVSKRSKARTLQAQLLREMTSLDSAEQRAKIGAGMPARKDFFRLHGADDVPGMEYLNWREFLRFNGSRARRRDRVFGDRRKKDIRDTHWIYTKVHRELLACLRVAGLHMNEYAGTKKMTIKHENIIATLRERAAEAVRSIFEAAGYRNDSKQWMSKKSKKPKTGGA